MSDHTQSMPAYTYDKNGVCVSVDVDAPSKAAAFSLTTANQMVQLTCRAEVDKLHIRFIYNDREVYAGAVDELLRRFEAIQ